jgi:hypothetical protein
VDAASTSFVLGYHGCDRKLAERVFSGRAALRASHNDYDWLGDGIYFWEHNANRAFEFATEVATRRHGTGQKIKTPAVVGAIIDLGFCLNLLDARFIEMVRAAYEELVRSSAESGIGFAKEYRRTRPPQAEPGLRRRANASSGSGRRRQGAIRDRPGRVC